MDNNFNGNDYNNVQSSNVQNNYNYQQVPGKDPGHGFAIASLVCGIVGLVLSCCCTILGIILGIVGVVLAIVAKNKSYTNSFEKMALAGLILSGIAIVFSIVNLILGAALGASLGSSDFSDQFSQYM